MKKPVKTQERALRMVPKPAERGWKSLVAKEVVPAG
nr:MAG TPA: hypothetical protein [Caudoviricetes sp.]